MRGGVNLNQLYQLDSKDRLIIGKIIEENLEITKNTGIAFV